MLPWEVSYSVRKNAQIYKRSLRVDRTTIGGLNITLGYDTGVISAVLVSLGDDLGHKLSSSEQELITSLTSGGALIGALIAGLPADKYGRKLGIYIGCVLFLIGSIIQAAAFSLPQMAVGRFVVGLGVGSAAMIVVSTEHQMVKRDHPPLICNPAAVHRRISSRLSSRPYDCSR